MSKKAKAWDQVMYVPRPNEVTGTNGAKAIPAVVIQGFEEGSVDLKAFTLGSSDLNRQGVEYNKDKLPGTWHWA